MLLFLTLTVAQAFLYPEEHEIFNPREISSINRVGDNWLLCSTAGNKLWLFSPEGERLATVDKQGLGPGELQWPWVIGVADGRIYVATMNARVQAFDEALRLIEDATFPRLMLPMNTLMTAGYSVGDKTFMTHAALSMKAPMVKRLVLGDDAWQIAEERLPQRVPFADIRNNLKPAGSSTTVAYHAGHYFYQPEKFQEPRYEIQVFAFPNLAEGQAIASLANQTEAYQPLINGVHAALNAAVRLKDGWLLEIQVDDAAGDYTMLHDRYDAAGKFVSRQTYSSEVKIHPVVNAPVAFIYRGDRERSVLELFSDPNHLWAK